jgi:hypothetical protein
MALERQHDALRPVVAPPDEQPYAEAAGAAPLVRRADRGRVADAAAAAALARMPRRDRYVPRRFACDPRFEVHNRRRVDWTRKRRAELHAMTGGVSHAVGAMLAAAGWLYAAGEYAAERGAETGDLEMFKTAASLTATARTHDMGAWELATREGKARPVDPKNWPGFGRDTTLDEYQRRDGDGAPEAEEADAGGTTGDPA